MSQPDNTLIVMWAAKGGAGTTVTATAAALHATGQALLVDLAGDAATVLGRRERELGVCGWLASDAEPDRLIEFTERIDDTTNLIAAGTADPEQGRHRSDRLEQLAGWLKHRPGVVIVDAGTRPPIPELHFAADRNVLVTRADYLALTAAQRSLLRPDAVFVIDEAGRALGHDDIERALNAPVIGHVDLDPSIARAVDAGLFIGHPALERATREVTASVGARAARPRQGARRSRADFGTPAQSRDPTDTWRVRYDADDQTLRAMNNRTGGEVDLGVYADAELAEQDLPGWTKDHVGPSIDWTADELGIDQSFATEGNNPSWPSPELGLEL